MLVRGVETDTEVLGDFFVGGPDFYLSEHAQLPLSQTPATKHPPILANEPRLNASTADAETVDHMIESLVAEA